MLSTCQAEQGCMVVTVSLDQPSMETCGHMCGEGEHNYCQACSFDPMSERCLNLVPLPLSDKFNAPSDTPTTAPTSSSPAGMCSLGSPSAHALLSSCQASQGCMIANISLANADVDLCGQSCAGDGCRACFFDPMDGQCLNLLPLPAPDPEDCSPPTMAPTASCSSDNGYYRGFTYCDGDDYNLDDDNWGVYQNVTNVRECVDICSWAMGGYYDGSTSACFCKGTRNGSYVERGACQGSGFYKDCRVCSMTVQAYCTDYYRYYKFAVT